MFKDNHEKIQPKDLLTEEEMLKLIEAGKKVGRSAYYFITRKGIEVRTKKIRKIFLFSITLFLNNSCLLL